MAEPCFHLEPISETVIKLQWQGRPPRLITRTVVPMALALFAVAYLGAITLSFSQKLPEDWLWRFEVLWRLAAAYAIFSIPLIIIYAAMLWSIASTFAYWTMFAWNKDDRQFHARKAGWLGLASEKISIPLAELRQVRMRLPAESRKLLPIELAINEQYVRAGKRPFAVSFTIHKVEKRTEAIDLLFRIANFTGLPWYSEGDSNVRTHEITITIDRKNPQAHRVPSSVAPPDYAEDLVLTPALKEKIPTFNLGLLRSELKATEMAEWSPGLRIQILRPGEPRSFYAVISLLGAAAGGLFGGFLFVDTFGSIITPVLLSASFGGIAAPLGFISKHGRREIRFDWPSRQLIVHTFGRPKGIPFSDLTELRLVGLKTIQRRRRRTNLSFYRTRLDIYSHGHRQAIIETEKWSSDPESAHRSLVPLTAALASSLRIPWHWEEFATREERLWNRTARLFRIAR